MAFGTFSALILTAMIAGCFPQGLWRLRPGLPSPSCSISLEASQIQQVRENRDLVRLLEKNPSYLKSSQHQHPIVTLTYRQKRLLLRRFPDLFRQSDGTTSAGDPRQRRNTAGRVCPPRPDSEPLILARTADGQVVQLVQEVAGHNQWIMDEICSAQQDGDMACGLAEREMPALFINLSGILATEGSDADFDMAYIVVNCCVAMRE
ncbi:uncharacterized protein LOC110982586 isoform X2 [Acanthaster planci]|uniref:Uncharacterized protein LOC110982586 isoform X2 n=1 Tax=Acanthaster planci TaxID=133434 RepID=A0A8B7Z025_ACAPL|nr:uncharacterized protein LOC110982586 isoform X2 [Acanthaster planci]